MTNISLIEANAQSCKPYAACGGVEGETSLLFHSYMQCLSLLGPQRSYNQRVVAPEIFLQVVCLQPTFTQLAMP